MEFNELQEKVRHFLREDLGVADGSVGPDTELVTSGLIDSAGLVRLATILEEATGIVIPDRDIKADHFDTLAKIDTYLRSRSRD